MTTPKEIITILEGYPKTTSTKYDVTFEMSEYDISSLAEEYRTGKLTVYDRKEYSEYQKTLLLGAINRRNFDKAHTLLDEMEAFSETKATTILVVSNGVVHFIS